MTQAKQFAAQAAQWQAAGRIDMAAQLYGAALQHDPSQFTTRVQLADCLAYLGRAEPAAEQYLMVAQAYAARGYPSECLALCERIIAVAPHTFVYVSTGPMLRRIGRQAQTVCARAAEYHLASGRQTDGLQLLRLGAELDPQSPTVRVQLAQIYRSRHMVREAVDALSDAGDLLLQAKRYPEYIGVAQHLLTIAPDHVATLRDLPRAHLELGRPQDAVQALGRLNAVSPGDIAGYELLAQAFAMLGHTDRARSVLARLVEQLRITGRADQADDTLNHARYWRPTDAEFTRAIERLKVPRPPPPVAIDRSPAPVPEGTVTLNIADLLTEGGTSVSPVPSGEPGVEWTEAEGTLTLRLADLILDETSPDSTDRDDSSLRVAPSPSEVNSTMSLDGRALMEMLVHTDSTVSPLGDATEQDEPHEPATQDMPPRAPSARGHRSDHAVDSNDLSATRPFPPTAAARPATTPPRPSASAHREGESGEDSEPETLLHMKPLTALDIARARPGHGRAASSDKSARARGAPPRPSTDEPATVARMPRLTAADIAEVMSGAATTPVSDPPTDTSATLPFLSSSTGAADASQTEHDAGDDDATVMNEKERPLGELTPELHGDPES